MFKDISADICEFSEFGEKKLKKTNILFKDIEKYSPNLFLNIDQYIKEQINRCNV